MHTVTLSVVETVVKSKANDFIDVNCNLELFDDIVEVLLLFLLGHRNATVIVDTALKSVIASHEGWLQSVVFQILVDLMHRTAAILALIRGVETH